jgi:hypothetical protein
VGNSSLVPTKLASGQKTVWKHREWGQNLDHKRGEADERVEIIVL